MSNSSKDFSGLFPINTVDNNIHYISKIYKINSKGYFGIKGKKGSANWIRQIFSKDPVYEAINFYDCLKNGGCEKPLANGHGFITTMPDGSKITIRIVTSSKGSPAVDLKLEGFHNGIKSHQKIHFVKEES